MMALLAWQQLWGYSVFLEKGTPRSSESALLSVQWDLALFRALCGPRRVEGLFPLSWAGWLPSCTQLLGLWAPPPPLTPAEDSSRAEAAH